jgi:hypothetical protein
MAKVVISGNQLVLQLSLWEKLGALHGSPRATKSALTKIEFIDQLWGSHSLRGIRSPGTALPYVVLLGTLRGKGYKDFVAMKGRGRGCILTFTDGPFERWIFTVGQPESELTGLLSAP